MVGQATGTVCDTLNRRERCKELTGAECYEMFCVVLLPPQSVSR